MGVYLGGLDSFILIIYRDFMLITIFENYNWECLPTNVDHVVYWLTLLQDMGSHASKPRAPNPDMTK